MEEILNITPESLDTTPILVAPESVDPSPIAQQGNGSCHSRKIKISKKPRKIKTEQSQESGKR